jgi:L-asparagine transporter-like permease
MDETEAAELSPADDADKKYLTVRQAAFIGVGAMVGAGIFALLGAAGEVAGAAVWLSFLIAGFVAVLLTFMFTTLIHEPASIATLLGVLALSIGLNHGWKRIRPGRPVPVQVGP